MKLMKQETNRLFKQISEETGVNPDDVHKVLERLGLFHSIEMLTEVAGKEKVQDIDIGGVIVGVKVARVPVIA